MKMFMSYVRMLRFSVLKCKWSDLVTNALPVNQVHVIHDCLTVSHFKSMIYLYHGSENCKN